jgi:hypothetical protein
MDVLARDNSLILIFSALTTAMTPSIHKETKFTDPCCAGIDEAGRGPVLGKLYMYIYIYMKSP